MSRDCENNPKTTLIQVTAITILYARAVMIKPVAWWMRANPLSNIHRCDAPPATVKGTRTNIDARETVGFYFRRGESSLKSQKLDVELW